MLRKSREKNAIHTEQRQRQRSRKAKAAVAKENDKNAEFNKKNCLNCGQRESIDYIKEREKKEGGERESE